MHLPPEGNGLCCARYGASYRSHIDALIESIGHADARRRPPGSVQDRSGHGRVALKHLAHFMGVALGLLSTERPAQSGK